VADIIRARHEAEGIGFRLGSGVASCQAGAAGIVLGLADGSEVAADVVVVGVGVRPDDGLAREAGLRTDDGILVDENCRTSDPDIFAAGDATRFRHAGSQGFRREENWRHALDHGAVAGANAAGGDAAYRAVSSFWSEQYDLFIQGLGSLPAAAADPVRRLHGERKLIHFHMAGDRIGYAVGLGAAKEMAAVRRMIERGIPVPPETLADPRANLAAWLR
jgi:NADPH-dependent 2,4-dienoyl-CoA reductase/sulfur reductase-like enzyme